MILYGFCTRGAGVIFSCLLFYIDSIEWFDPAEYLFVIISRAATKKALAIANCKQEAIIRREKKTNELASI